MRIVLAAGLALLGLAAPAFAQPAIPEIRQRGEVLCGVNGDLPGFSDEGPGGRMVGLDADLCRAVAAAVLGDAAKVRFVPQPTPEAALDALAARQVDLVARNTTVTLTRDGGRPVTPGPVVFFDGMGLMVPVALGVSQPGELGGRTVCWAGAEGARGTAGDVLDSVKERYSVQFTARRLDTQAAALAALEGGECHALAADSSALAARRAYDLRDAAAWSILPHILSPEPLAPWVRANDEDFRVLVFWTVQGLFGAEQLGVTSANLPERLANPDWQLRRMLGLEAGLGAPFGLPDTWLARVIQQVGNYGEIFERNLGSGSRIGMERGINALWTAGGLIYPLPLR